LRYISWRYTYPFKGLINVTPKPTHLMIDHSDLAVLQSIPQYKKKLNNIIEFEKNLNKSLIFDQNNIRVYKLED
jgi:hypothetical protein